MGIPAVGLTAEDLEPHDGVAGVLMVGGAVLMFKHRKFGFWTVPVGKAKPGQAPEEGMLEEVSEETGVSPTDYELIGTFSCPDELLNPNGGKWFEKIYVYLIREYVGEPTNAEPEKHPEMRWVPIEGLDALGELSGATRVFIEWIAQGRDRAVHI